MYLPPYWWFPLALFVGMYDSRWCSHFREHVRARHAVARLELRLTLL